VRAERLLLGIAVEVRNKVGDVFVSDASDRPLFDCRVIVERGPR
jgi:hypothetical protein